MSDLVSVVTVSYNGRALLAELLPALAAQTYRPLEVVVVDNASTDGTAEWVRRAFPQARLVASRTNLGFAGGNNLGIESSRGRFVALVNNDTVPDPTWLEALVAAAAESPDIGAVASKIVFLTPYLPLALEIPAFVPGGADGRELGVMYDVASRVAGSNYPKPVFHAGFYPPERGGGREFRWTRPAATVFLPLPPDGGDRELRLIVAGGERAPERRLELAVGDTRLGTLTPGSGFSTHRVTLPAAAAARESFDVINNAGSFLDERGVAGDRGIYQPDRGQFDRPEDVEAVCGASVLLRREALARAGPFDPDFFMYYEDIDLSWRLRAAGYRLRYAPASRVRHRHATSSVEWSPMFTFLTARNRILLLAKNGSLRHTLAAYLLECRVLLGLARAAAGGRPGARGELRTRLRVQASLARRLPAALLRRRRAPRP